MFSKFYRLKLEGPVIMIHRASSSVAVAAGYA